MNWSAPGPLAASPVSGGETLSRFLFQKGLRADGSVRPEEFVPYPYEDLSVLRQKGLTPEEVSDYGDFIATKRGRKLKGRADFPASSVPPDLNVFPEEPPRNHANIVGWPSERSLQLSHAQILSAACGKGIL